MDNFIKADEAREASDKFMTVEKLIPLADEAIRNASAKGDRFALIPYRNVNTSTHESFIKFLEIVGYKSGNAVGTDYYSIHW